eukprot:948708-Pelagomonas_calceolata.AAC.1
MPETNQRACEGPTVQLHHFQPKKPSASPVRDSACTCQSRVCTCTSEEGGSWADGFGVPSGSIVPAD